MKVEEIHSAEIGELDRLGDELSGVQRALGQLKRKRKEDEDLAGSIVQYISYLQ